MKKTIKTVLHRLWDMFSFVLILVFLAIGTYFIYMYANGYRFNLQTQKVERTGVVSVETLPSRAEAFINGVDLGKTPKITTSISEGTATVKFQKTGYYDWSRIVPVNVEKSSLVYALLIKQNPNKDEVFSTEGDMELTSNNIYGYDNLFKTKNSIFFGTSHNSIYRLWRYDVNRNFWETSANPYNIYTLNDKNITGVSYSYAPDGRNLLVFVNTTDPKTKKPNQTAITLLEVNGTQVVKNNTDLSPFVSYNISWSQDGKYLLLDSSSELVTMNVSDGKKYLILKKDPKKPVMWSTDDQGNLYTVEKDTTATPNFTLINQMNLDGTNKIVLLNKIYALTEDKYIRTLQKDSFSSTPFGNPTDNILFSGSIDRVVVDQLAQGIFLSTNYASYWYDFNLKEYILINPYQSEFIGISTDKTFLLFRDKVNNKLGIFTIKTEENNPVEKLGTKFIVNNVKSSSNISWLGLYNIVYPNSDGNLHIVDRDGYNDYSLFKSETSLYQFETSKKYLHLIANPTTDNDKTFTKIFKYTIN
ncbi:MAG TPA: PEGA domain-containing protein [Candidatus Dojkabacteria bacterium]|nr:PEGA domain-containing protein [Candidatus Dojkabacteria bacterium]